MDSFFPPFEDDIAAPPEGVPLFPLSKSVLLPGEPLPLHIFEERYRLMTESAISSERLIAMAHTKPESSVDSIGDPEMYNICGLGRIVMDEKLSDGRFNLILMGLKRVKIQKIIQEKPYKRAQVEILPDRFSNTSSTLIQSLTSDINGMGQNLLALRKKNHQPTDIPFPHWDSGVLNQLPLGTLCDVFAAALTLPALEKQMIIEETDVIRRAEILLFSIRFELESFRRGSGSSFILH